MSMSSEKVLGLHHMTAICGHAQENVDFFVGFLGLRFLKLTVNFDDPTAHHLYYGDGLGSPGTIITFFPYPTGGIGKVGNGMVGTTSLSIPQNAMGFWAERFGTTHLSFDKPMMRGDEEVLAFETQDGLPMELVASEDHKPGKPWKDMPISEEHAISGMRGVRIFAAEAEATQAVVTGVLGFERGVELDGGARYRAEDGSLIDVLERPKEAWGRGGHGTVHHIAFRAKDDDAQLRLLEKIHQNGLQASPVMDRNYFHSIYFREPGHVLFEIATDPPGFTADESAETLGTALKLPAQYEPYRAQIEATLPKLRIPGREGVLS
jgi:glyoxalase family protein